MLYGTAEVSIGSGSLLLSGQDLDRTNPRASPLPAKAMLGPFLIPDDLVSIPISWSSLFKSLSSPLHVILLFSLNVFPQLPPRCLRADWLITSNICRAEAVHEAILVVPPTRLPRLNGALVWIARKKKKSQECSHHSFPMSMYRYILYIHVSRINT